MKRTGLYREQALRANQGKWLGEILLISPIQINIAVVLAFSFLLCLIALMCFGSYTKYITVPGVLIPEGGIIKVYAAQPGVVVRRMISEGEIVKKGQILYTISSERQVGHVLALQTSISHQAESRRRSYTAELNNVKISQQEERSALLRKIQSSENFAEKLNEQIKVQIIQIKLAEHSWDRYKELLQRGYINTPQVEEKQQAFLEMQGRQRSLERDFITANSEVSALKSEWLILQTKQQSALAQIERNVEAAIQDFAESEAKRELSIVAPESGIATGVFADVGHAVDITHPLVSVARQSNLQIRLFVPTKSIGLIVRGSSVRLRYKAFPYQRYGFGKASILSISNVAFDESELAMAKNTSLSDQSLGPVYVVEAKLQSQTVGSITSASSLRAGMVAEADIIQERHRIVEWALSPLRHLSETM